jgi:dienelactone hydrolase
MCKLTKALGLTVLLGALGSCGSLISFQNAKLSDSDAARTISGLLAKPPGEGPFPAVVLLHSCGGLQGPVTTDWPDYLTSLGYVSLAVDSFGPRGIRRCPTPLSGDRKELSRDAYGGLQYLASLPFVDKQRIGVMGFSMGGNTVGYLVGQEFRTPSGLNFKAAVSVYGNCRLLLEYTKTIPTTIVIGERENKERLLACSALTANSRPSIMVHVLPDAYHAFDNPRYTTVTNDTNGNPMLYSGEATTKAREIIKVFLAEFLSK